MPRLTPALIAAQSEIGFEIASKFSGVPRATLIDHAEKKRFPFRVLNTGKRLITRQALLDYLEKRGLKPRKDLDRRGDPRMRGYAGYRVRLKVLDPELDRRTLGEGVGRIADLSVSGMRLTDLSWKGLLSGPDTEVVFEVLGGGLRDSQGIARVAWILYKGGEFQMGFRLSRLKGRGQSARWQGFIQSGIQALSEMEARQASSN